MLPMSLPDLRAVITQPAGLSDVQLTFEGDLVGEVDPLSWSPRIWGLTDLLFIGNRTNIPQRRMSPDPVIVGKCQNSEHDRESSRKVGKPLQN
jgi:hypothetical protein